MPTSLVIGEAVNFDELKQAFNEAPGFASKFVKTALLRFSRRVSHRIKKEYLHGEPGIKGGPWARIKDKNINGFTVGSDLTNLKAVNKASRIVRTHIEGAVITAKAGGFLFLSKKSGKGSGKVFARVRSVTIPARIPFEQIWRAEQERGIQEVGDALHRAISLSMEQRMKVLSSYVNKVLSHG